MRARLRQRGSDLIRAGGTTTTRVPADDPTRSSDRPRQRGETRAAALRGLAVPQTPAWAVAIIGIALVGATVVATLLEGWVGVTDASPVYLLAVVLAAALFGTPAAIATSVLAVLAYDFLFTDPRLTLAVASPQEWLSLLLFLLVAVVIGRLAALLRERAEEAHRRAAEARSLFAISHSLAAGASIAEAAGEIVTLLGTRPVSSASGSR